MHKQLLLEWCNGLKRLQVGPDAPPAFRGPAFRGGILCPACGRIHGRSADAMLAFLCAGGLTGDERFFQSAEELFQWSEENVACQDGSYINDPANAWKGTTIFSLQTLILCLEYYRKYLSEETVLAMEKRIELMAAFYCDHIDTFDTNINYYIAGAAGLEAAARFLGRVELHRKAGELMNRSLTYITDQGLIIGEGKCKRTEFDARTPKGCQAIDIGYNVEENIPSLLHYAFMTSNQTLVDQVVKIMDAHLNFLLPDGGWDNSWGTRNAKWSYWGSRTSDGCQGAYAYLPQDRFLQAAGLNLALLSRCTHDGLLTGGPMYHLSGEKTCVHHTICHARMLAECLAAGREIKPREYVQGMFPNHAKQWNHGSVCTARRGQWYASVTAGDYQYVKGSTPSGGTVTLLHEAVWGPVLAATMSEYRLSEPFNMQYPLHWKVGCQTFRIETENGSSAACMDASLDMEEEEDVRITARGLTKEGYKYKIEYMLTDGAFRMTAVTAAPGAKLILPVIASLESYVTTGEGSLTMYIERDEMRLKVDSSARLYVRAESSNESVILNKIDFPSRDLYTRYFNPVGGFLYVQAEIPMNVGEEVSVTFHVEPQK